MRLTLDPQPLQINAAAPSDDEETPRRIVGGLIVPYGETAIVGGRAVTFDEGSVHAKEHVPLILSHDLTRPIGVMLTGKSGAAGFSGVFAVDATPDGDVALTQAMSGSRRGLSGGIDVIEMEESEDGALRVIRGELAEVSQVTLAAYAAAAIDTVAAHRSEEEQMESPEQTPTPTPADEHLELERRPVIVVAEREAPRMRLGQYVQTLLRAHRGDSEARVRIEAALDRGELAENPGVVPIAYVNQVLDSLGAERVLFDAFSHAELPPAGMTIRRPVITARPSGGWLATDADPAPTGPITIGQYDTDIEQWAHGVAASAALVERSAPSFVEEAFTQMVKAYFRAVEEKLGDALESIAAPATTPPTTLGGAGALFTTAYGSWPNLIVAGPTAYGEIVDAIGPMRYSSGSADLSGNATMAGLRVVCAPNVTAADVWITRSELYESRESTPIRLSVSDVTSLSLEIGVTAFYAMAITIQGTPTVNGAVRIAGYTPAAAAQSGGQTRKRSE